MHSQRDRKIKEKNESLGYSLPIDSFVCYIETNNHQSSSRFCSGEIQSTTTLQGMDGLLEHLLQDDNRPRDLAESEVSHFSVDKFSV